MSLIKSSTASPSLAEALPAAIAKVSEWIGQHEEMAKQMNELSPGAGDGSRLMVRVVRDMRDTAVVAQQSGDVVAMIAAYQNIKPALDLATGCPQ